MEMEQEMDEEMEQELFEEDQFQEPEEFPEPMQFPEAEPPQEAEFGQGPRASLSLSSQEKNLIVQFLQQQCRAGALPHGSLIEAATKSRVHPRTASRLWRIAAHQIEQGQPVVMKGEASGYTKKKVKKLAIKMEVSKSTAGRWVKGNKIRPHTNAIKPALTDVNKISRMRWSLSHIQPTISEGKLLYHAMHNIVHIDEKWFYMTKTSDRYYLLPEEDEPYRSFSRPLFGSDGQPIFDGKIGIFPFTQQVPAKRKSKNRPRGTLETKSIQSVSKEAMRECLLNQATKHSITIHARIIPTIKAKWSANANKEIYIQQDNAKPHLKSSDLQFEAIASTDGFKFHLVSQPANSPDTNVLDLGFFRAIQSLQDDKLATNIDELLANVWRSFEELTPQTLNNVFLTLQSCLTKILEVHGGNNYKIPHLNKDRLSRTVGLPTSLEVEENLIRDSLEYLLLPHNDVGGSYEIGHLSNVLG
ncbi:uncharacterized protein LOC121770254 [Salvia splendens]|uniref:uncharacterized protein LOC121770254 n=1 Tax=Salvia splendens TaxID=180675 RepID=UPI001C260D0C|nr:uncharacterized protein LOC121770254 [Salvia splendens]